MTQDGAGAEEKHLVESSTWRAQHDPLSTTFTRVVPRAVVPIVLVGVEAIAPAVAAEVVNGTPWKHQAGHVGATVDVACVPVRIEDRAGGTAEIEGSSRSADVEVPSVNGWQHLGNVSAVDFEIRVIEPYDGSSHRDGGPWSQHSLGTT